MYIKMMNEYSVDWPFWNPAGRNPDLDLPYLLSDMDDPLPHLPDDLAAQVRSWTRQFAENYERHFRWPSQEMARAHGGRRDAASRRKSRQLSPWTQWCSTTGRPATPTMPKTPVIPPRAPTHTDATTPGLQVGCLRVDQAAGVELAPSPAEKRAVQLPVRGHSRHRETTGTTGSNGK